MKFFYCNGTVKKYTAVFITVLLLFISSIPNACYLNTDALYTQIKHYSIDAEKYISRYSGGGTRLSSVHSDGEIARKLSRLNEVYGKADYEENRLIVKLKNSSLNVTNFGAVEAIVAPDNIFILQFANAELASNALERLKQEPAVEYAEPDSEVALESENESTDVMTPTSPADAPLTAADEYISWGAQFIGADEYSAYLKKLNVTKQIKIAVVDSGIDAAHEEFDGRTLYFGHDYMDNDDVPQDEMGHGSHTAGIIADLTRDFSNISLYPIKVFNRYGTGSSASIGYAIRSAANNGADIINLSLSCTSTDFVNESVSMAVDKGSLIVFAAGNNAYLCDKCPIDISDKEGILVVSSVNSNGTISDFSNFSDIVDVAAPGENINGVNFGGGYTLKSGTSMAAPHISAAAALLKCEYPAAGPALLERMIKAFTSDAGQIGFDSFYGFGVCDLSLAVDSKIHTVKSNGDDITYIVKNNEATLQKVITSKQAFTVEQALNGYPVTGIAESAFFDCKGIKSITLPDCIEHIAPQSFARCTSLERIDALGDEFCSKDGILYNTDFTKLISYPPAKSGTAFTIPENTLYLEYGAFYNCSNLNTVTLNAKLEDLGNAPFKDCNNLKRIYAGSMCEHFTDISGVLYDKNRTKLIKYPPACPVTDITLPETVNEICDEALENGASLKTLHSYNSLRRIGKSAFAGCASLTSVSIYNGLLYIDDMAFWRCGALKNIAVPQTVTQIGRYAFAECTAISTAEIGKNIVNLGSGAFYKCISVTSVTVSTPISDYGYRVFNGCTSLKTAVISDGVTVLGKYMFAGCTKLDGIIIPSSVKSIYAAAFSGCSSLKSIDINSGLTSLQSSVFSNCYSLCTLDLPDTLKSIGSKAFAYCASLSAVIVPDSVESIASFAFLRCTALRTLYLGISVQEVPDYCFDGCESLEYLFVMGNTSSINMNAFEDCGSLTKITVSSYNSRYASPSGVLIDKSACTLLLYPPKKNTVSYTIPENITRLADGAFKNNQSLASLIIPNRVTEIGEDCFSGVNSLKSLTIGNILATNTLYSLFPDSVSLLETVRITADFSEIKEGMFEKCSSLAAISVPSSVTRIGDRAFSGCSSLRIITLPATVSYIGERAFYRCDKLTYVNVPDNLTEIKPYTFYGCRSLTEVNVPDTVVEIGERAFYNCAGLKDINIPADITVIHPYTFYGCRGLTSMNVPYYVTEIGEYAFYGCSSVEEMYIPESVKKIGGYAFSGMSRLKEITLEEGLSELGSGAFEGCAALDLITVPDTVTFIGFNCFAKCTALTQINLSNGINVITKNLFLDCTSLKSVCLPFGITDINESAFSGCTQLESVTCGTQIQNIGRLAFNGCSRLGSIQLYDNISYISADAFNGCSKINLLCGVNSYTHRYAAQNGIYYTVVFNGDGWSAYMTPENDILTSFDMTDSINLYGSHYRISAYSGADKVDTGATLGMSVICATSTDADMYVISSYRTDTGVKTALEYSIENGCYKFDISEFDRISLEKGIKGDANLDGKYNTHDVSCLLDILTSSIDCVSVQSRLADINDDGETNLLDAYLMLVQNNT